MKAPNTSPTIYDVAEKAGVSIATVSRVLNAPDLVSGKTRKKVLSAIDELGLFQKRMRAIGREEILDELALLHRSSHCPSFAQRLRGIAAALVNSTYDLMVYPVDSMKRLESYFTVLPFSQQLDGLIIVSLPVDETYIRRFQQSKIPILMIENHVPGFPSVEIDNWLGGKMAAKHLLEKGHKRCAYVGDTVTPEYTLSPEDDRLKGYRKTLMKNGVELPDEYIILPAFPPKDPDKQVHELLDQKNHQRRYLQLLMIWLYVY